MLRLSSVVVLFIALLSASLLQNSLSHPTSYGANGFRSRVSDFLARITRRPTERNQANIPTSAHSNTELNLSPSAPNTAQGEVASNPSDQEIDHNVRTNRLPSRFAEFLARITRRPTERNQANIPTSAHSNTELNLSPSAPNTAQGEVASNPSDQEIDHNVRTNRLPSRFAEFPERFSRYPNARIPAQIPVRSNQRASSRPIRYDANDPIIRLYQSHDLEGVRQRLSEPEVDARQALRFAAAENKMDLLETLFSSNAYSYTSYELSAAFDYALENGHLEMMQRLSQDPEFRILSPRLSFNEARTFGYENIAEWIQQQWPSEFAYDHIQNSLQVKVKYDKPLESFYEALMKGDSSHFKTNELKIEYVGENNEKLNGQDAGGLRRDFLSRSLHQLFFDDLKDAKYPLQDPLVSWCNDKENTRFELSNYYITENMPPSPRSESLLKYYNFMGKAMAYAIARNQPDSALSFSPTLLNSLLEKDFDLKLALKENNKLMGILRTFNSQEDLDVMKESDLFNPTISAKQMDGDKVKTVELFIKKSGQLDPNSDDENLAYKYEFLDSNKKFEKLAYISIDEEIDDLLSRMSVQDKLALETEAKAMLVDLHSVPLDQIRKGIYSIIPKEEFQQRFTDGESLKRALYGAEMIDVNQWKSRTEVSGTASITPQQLNNMKEYFWKFMESKPAEIKTKWLQFVTGANRFSDESGQPIMKVSIFPADNENQLPTSSTCSNLIKIPLTRNYEEFEKKMNILEKYIDDAGFDLV